MRSIVLIYHCVSVLMVRPIKFKFTWPVAIFILWSTDVQEEKSNLYYRYLRVEYKRGVVLELNRSRVRVGSPGPGK